MTIQVPTRCRFNNGLSLRKDYRGRAEAVMNEIATILVNRISVPAIAQESFLHTWNPAAQIASIHVPADALWPAPAQSGDYVLRLELFATVAGKPFLIAGGEIQGGVIQNPDLSPRTYVAVGGVIPAGAGPQLTVTVTRLKSVALNTVRVVESDQQNPKSFFEIWKGILL